MRDLKVAKASKVVGVAILVVQGVVQSWWVVSAAFHSSDYSPAETVAEELWWWFLAAGITVGAVAIVGTVWAFACVGVGMIVEDRPNRRFWPWFNLILWVLYPVIPAAVALIAEGAGMDVHPSIFVGVAAWVVGVVVLGAMVYSSRATTPPGPPHAVVLEAIAELEESGVTVTHFELVEKLENDWPALCSGQISVRLNGLIYQGMITESSHVPARLRVTNNKESK